jgi:hypothetical protein
VALSLLELNEQANFGIIEIAMNEPNDIKEMIELVQPSHFIVTSFFKDQPTLNLALVEVLNSMPNVFSGEFYEALSPNVKILDQAFASPELKQVSFTDSVIGYRLCEVDRLRALLYRKTSIYFEAISLTIGNL